MRTTHRSTNGTKLYAVRSKAGKFTDIQTHKRASAADQRKRSKAEHTWVRWCVLWPSEIWPEYYVTREAALVDSRRFVGRSKVCRVEIAAGVPDPLRKRR